MLGDSVMCWCLFSGWRQCWVTLYCVGVCFQGGSSAGWLCIVLVFVFRVVAVLGDSVLCWCLFYHISDAGDSVLCWCLFYHMLDAG